MTVGVEPTAWCSTPTALSHAFSLSAAALSRRFSGLRPPDEQRQHRDAPQGPMIQFSVAAMVNTYAGFTSRSKVGATRSV